MPPFGNQFVSTEPQSGDLTPSQIISYIKENVDITNEITDQSFADAGEFLSESEIEDTKNELTTINNLNNLTKDSKYLEATTLLPGIYGFIEDADNNNERITLSLTPYEIAPRLSDFRLFGNNNTTTGLQTAMTVGNRLQASRVFTNFMQETLPAQGEASEGLVDPRFTSKENRIGSLSRFLNDEGDPSDKSTFLHIVPDVESTGGKIEIQYARYDKDGIRSEKNGTAFVPVNFNFTSSKYTLTIKEFIIENVSESSREIYSLNKSFDGYTLRMFGQHPEIISFNGILTNFDDDAIGLDDEFRNTILKPDGLADSGSAFSANLKGSQRDAFLTYYQNFLAGTKCRDYSMKLFFYYNHRIIEGYLIEMSMSTNSSNDNFVMFGGNIIVRRKYSTFETNSGLASSIPSTLRNLNRGIYGQDITSGNGSDGYQIFEKDKSFRLNYREFALIESQKLIKQASSNNRGDYSRVNNGNIITKPQEDDKWISNPAKFDKTENSEDLNKLNEWCFAFMVGVTQISTANVIGLETTEKQTAAAKILAKYLLDNVTIKFGDLVKWVSEKNEKTFYVFRDSPAPEDILEDIVTIYEYIKAFYGSTSNIGIIDDNRISENLASNVFYVCYFTYFSEKPLT